jgi:hypothetical protein
MTHDQLVTLAAAWLRKKKRVAVVLQDVRCMMTSEQPDVIGWGNAGFSVLVEVKASPGDLLRDADKTFRKAPERGMGYTRWYAFEKGFLESYPSSRNHIPGSWGIVEIDEKGRAKELHKPSPFHVRNERDERVLLVQAVRKATEGWGRKTFGEIAPPMLDGDPHPSASKVIRELRTENLRLRRELQKHRDVKPANLLKAESLPEGLSDARKATWLAINPYARVCLVGDHTFSSHGTVDGWVGPRLVRVRWDAGHITEVDAECLHVLVAASPRA